MPTVPADRPHLTPVPRTTDSAAHLPATGLPRPLSSFIGREQVVAAVCALLRREDVRLVTLTGPGGVGKTRLALAVADAISGEPRFAGGAAFVALAAVRDPTLVASAVAQTLGIREVANLPRLETLTAAIREERLLLVLDNLEHLLAAAPLVADLLTACPHLTILATSRAVLHVSGEHDYRVPPLSLSREAVRLFVERATASRHDFTLTDANVADVTAICARLDGLPLAIELAAARVRHLPPRALLARLAGPAGSQLPLLTGGAVDQPARHRTMHDTVVWSHDLLTATERAVFRRLAVFVGGFSLEAAEWVTVAGSSVTSDDDAPPPLTPHPSPLTLDAIASLADKSLLQPNEGPGGEARYLMLETVREYGLERLAASGEDEPVRRRHAEYFAAFLGAVDAPAFAGPDPALLFARADAEQDNVRAALAWADAGSDAPTLLRLATGLEASWALGGRLGEGRAWLDRALIVGEDGPAGLRAAALRAAGWFARDQGDHRRAAVLAEESLALFRAIGDATGAAQAQILLGLVAQDRGDPARAEALQRTALHLLAPLPQPFWTAVAMRQLGFSLYLRGDLEAAERQLEDALALCRRDGNRHIAVRVLSTLSDIARERGEHVRAAALWQERLGSLSWDARNLHQAFEALAQIALDRRDHGRAARLFGVADAQRRRLGISLVPSLLPLHEANVAATRSALGEEVFARTWDEGQRLSVAEAHTEAAEVARTGDVASGSAAGTAEALGLTRREQEVVRLLAEGQSDREIAAALFISPKTVGTHMVNILGKLGVPSRAAAVAFAHRHGLA